MNKGTFQVFIIIALLISNILLVFMLMNKQDHKSKRGGINQNRNIIIEKLDFDEKQIAQYDDLISEHRAAMKENRRGIRGLKLSLYEQINTNNQEQLDSIKKVLSKQHLDFEMIHYSHFKDIKSICKEEQLDLYNELIKELPRMFSPRGPHGKRHQREKQH